jgi:hypothetical protein
MWLRLWAWWRRRGANNALLRTCLCMGCSAELERRWGAYGLVFWYSRGKACDHWPVGGADAE